MARIPPLAKWVLSIVGVSLCLILLYFANSYRQLKLQSAAADRARAELEVGYQAQLLEYQQALRIGIPKAEVLEYLRNKKVPFSDWRGVLMVNLGREPDVFPCDSWTVYVSFEFGRSQGRSEPSGEDPLGAISLKRIGHCL